MLIGLTGGMGCGKSTTLNIFSEMGFKTLSADIICHELYYDKNSETFNAIHKRWGNKILTKSGNIDRIKIAKLVFSEPLERKWLNSLIHPEVLKKGLNIYKSSNNKVTIFDIPLLFEVGWEKYFNTITVVYTEKSERFKRLNNRGMTNEEIKKRDQSQLSPESKVERADYAIINNGTLDLLKKQCILLTKKLNKDQK